MTRAVRAQATVAPVAAIRLLLIDDDLRLGELLRGYLTPQGVALEQASSGEAGLAAAGGGFDAVLLDVSCR